MRRRRKRDTKQPARSEATAAPVSESPPRPQNRGSAAATVGRDNSGIVSIGDGATNVQVSLPDGALRPVTEVFVPPRLTNVPSRIGQFVGRDDELAELDATLHSGADVVVAAVYGPAGVGKSTLAARYAAARAGEFNLVWRITGDNPQSVQAGLAGLATALQPELSGLLPIEALAQRAMSWLAVHKGWLLILDNVTSPADVAPLFSPWMSGSILITTRLAEGWHQLSATILRLDVLSEEQALDLLTRIAVYGDAEADLDGGVELVRELGFLPLAVHQAAAYIHQRHLSPRAYLSLLTKHPAIFFDRSAQGMEAERTIARMWRITLDTIAGTPLANHLLRVLAWYAPESIPRTLLDDAGQSPHVEDAIGVLAAYSLITLTREAITVHRLVQAVARTPDANDPHRQAADITVARDHAVGLLTESLPSLDPEAQPAWRALLPHLDALFANTGVEADTIDASRLFNNTGVFLDGQGTAGRALKYIERAFVACQRALGPDHPATLSRRHNLASVVETVGDPRRAISMHKQLLADRRRILGPNHPDTLSSCNSLAGAYETAGDLEHALPLYEQALTDRERVLGADHPDTLISRNNLAFIYDAVGDLERALRLHEQTVADREQVLGADHPDTLSSCNSLAYAYEMAGDFGRALFLLKKTLTKSERVLGADHPTTLAIRDNLANVYRDTGDLKRAVPLHKRTLADRERIFGPDHRTTFTTRNNLATSYQAAGNLRRALPLHEQTLADRERVLGADHPDTLTSRSNLASTYEAMGHVAGAISLFEQALVASERVLGSDHPATLTTLNNLANTYRAAGDCERAVSLHKRALVGRQQVLGADHPDTLISRNNLAGAYRAAGDLNRAIPLYEQTLAHAELALGASHPLTSAVRDNLNATR
jgi:tetratricopeptide (TPR) repeat protein